MYICKWRPTDYLVNLTREFNISKLCGHCSTQSRKNDNPISSDCPKYSLQCPSPDAYKCCNCESTAISPAMGRFFGWLYLTLAASCISDATTVAVEIRSVPTTVWNNRDDRNCRKNRTQADFWLMASKSSESELIGMWRCDIAIAVIAAIWDICTLILTLAGVPWGPWCATLGVSNT